MNKYFNYKTLSLTVLLLALILSAGVVMAQSAGNLERVIVTFEHEVNEQAVQALENRGGQVLKSLSLVNGLVVYIPEQAIPALSTVAGVKTVEKDAVVFATQKPEKCSPWPGCRDDGEEEESIQPPQTVEWGIERIGADLAWAESRGEGVKVAIIDTGIKKDHADLAANVKGGINFVAPTTGPPQSRIVDPNKWDDDNGHGTHVAGIVAALDNDIGVVGVGPEVWLYGVKVLDKDGSGYVSDIIDALAWAIDNEMDVVNMSLGTASDISSFHQAVDSAYAAGLVLVASAGNSGDGNGSTNTVNYPAKYSSVIAVAATDINDQTPTWSSEGIEVELAAPGVNIRSTWYDGDYRAISGTSMASPHVAGVAALLLALEIPAGADSNNDGQWSPAELRVVLRDTAEDLGPAGHDVFYGYGLVRADWALGL